jgi:D-alanyl-D-alanine carboxypeptidase (penicillin-binding protein 5/6)
MTAGTQTPEPTASVAKLITALAVLNKYPLEPGQSGPTITLTAADVAIYKQYVAEDGSVVLVQAGEQITEYQALEAMMLPSANNIADSLAIWAFGSLANYSTFANQFVTTLGLAQTHIGSDASGFLPNTTSTASDLVALGLDAIKNPVLAAITSEAKATLPLAGTVDNVNWLLGEDGIFGIKTGNSNQAGGVYIFAAHDSIDANHIVTVVGALQGIATLQDALDQAVPLLNSVKQNFALSEVVQANQIVGYYKTPWGSATPAATKNSLTAVIWKGVPLQPTVSLTPLRSPESNGSLAGQLSLNSAGESLSVPIDLTQPIPKPPLLWRICHHKLDL